MIYPHLYLLGIIPIKRDLLSQFNHLINFVSRFLPFLLFSILVFKRIVDWCSSCSPIWLFYLVTSFLVVVALYFLTPDLLDSFSFLASFGFHSDLGLFFFLCIHFLWWFSFIPLERLRWCKVIQCFILLKKRTVEKVIIWMIDLSVQKVQSKQKIRRDITISLHQSVFSPPVYLSMH